MLKIGAEDYNNFRSIIKFGRKPAGCLKNRKFLRIVRYPPKAKRSKPHNFGRLVKEVVFEREMEVGFYVLAKVTWNLLSASDTSIAKLFRKMSKMLKILNILERSVFANPKLIVSSFFPENLTNNTLVRLVRLRTSRSS